jgi:hypothetical protein
VGRAADVGGLGHREHDDDVAGRVARERRRHRQQRLDRVGSERGDGDRRASPIPGAGALARRQLRVLAQDCPLELPELLTRADAELGDEEVSPFAVGLERLRLTAARVERAHQQRARMLAERVLVDERCRLGDRVARTAAGELRIEEPLAR